MSSTLGRAHLPLSRLRETPGGWPPSPAPEPQPRIESTAQSLSQAVRARKAEYVRKKTIKIKVGSWNVAAAVGTEKDVGGWFVDGKGDRTLSDQLEEMSVDDSGKEPEQDVESVADQEKRRSRTKTTIPKGDTAAAPGGDDIGLYVLGLQEVIDISSASETLRPYLDPNPGKRWKESMKRSLPPDYVKIAEHQLLGLLILIYASPEVASSVTSVSATSVGTGLMGYLGNKGAASVRLVLGETTKFLFVNCHLSAGADKASLTRRNWDASQIISRTRFAPIKEDDDLTEDPGDVIGDEDFGFWFGDLNYRLDDIPGDDVRRLLLLHTRNEYDVENKSTRKIDSELGYINAPSTESLPEPEPENLISRATLEGANVDQHIDPKSDPASLHTTIQSLLPHDQLRNQQKMRNAFHEGWQEGEIGFLPTYKYDIGSVGMFDSGEKKRSPSWCDRILYRSRQSKLAAEKRGKEIAEARKKDADMKARGIDEAEENSVLFDYDPDTDGLAYGGDYDETEDAANDAENTGTRNDSDDSITINQYISHQRVLSSDHKPLDAVFTVCYDAAIPELKAKILREVARDLDKAENESRPGVTVVVDNHPEETIESADGSTEPTDLDGVDFGKVKYGFPARRGLTIANTGQAPATFSFIDRPVAEGQKGGVAPPWLELRVAMASDNVNQNANALREYTLSPGETTSIQLIIDVVDLKMVHDLNARNTVIDDILVLRIIHGRDHFIPLKGLWLPSCLCRTLDELVSVAAGGVRSLKEAGDTLASKSSRDRSTLQRSNTRHSAPKELFMLTEAIQDLVERSVAEWDMIYPAEIPPWSGAGQGTLWPFNSQTWRFKPGEARSKLVATVIEALDTTTPFNELIPSDTPSLSRLEVLVEALFIFLKSLRDGIIPAELWPELEAQIVEQEKGKSPGDPEKGQYWVMEILSKVPVHSVSFTFVTFMLTRVMNELAPLSPEPSDTPRTPRLSTSSSLSETSDSIAPASPQTPSNKAFFIPAAFRRRVRTGTEATTGVAAEVLVRRKAIQQAYTETFASLLIRSDRDTVVKGKEKKSLETRKKKALDLFLDGSNS